MKHKTQDTQGVVPLKSKWKLENIGKKKAPVLNNKFKFVFSEPSQLSLKQVIKQQKQAMNDASHKVAQMDHFEIMEECIRKLLSGLN